MPDRSVMTAVPETFESLLVELTERCDALCRWAHLSSAMLVSRDGRVLARAGSDVPPVRSHVFCKLLVNRLLLVAIAGPDGQAHLATLTPEHGWFSVVTMRLQRYLDAAGPERADHELPVLTDADIDALFDDVVPGGAT